MSVNSRSIEGLKSLEYLYKFSRTPAAFDFNLIDVVAAVFTRVRLEEMEIQNRAA
jgi:hypothetical protein